MNPLDKPVTLQTDTGERLLLVADHAALYKAARAYTGGAKIGKLLRDMQPEMDADGKPAVDADGDLVKDTTPATAALLYGLLDAHHPQMTLRDATNLLLRDPATVAEAIGAAVEAHLAPPQAKVGNGQKSRKSRTSGSNGAKRA